MAVGNLDWVRSHSQADASASKPYTDPSNRSSTHAPYAEDLLSSQGRASSNSSSSSSSRSSSRMGDAVNDSDQQNAARSRSGEQASSSGASGTGDAGVMTVYVGIDGRLAGTFEIRDQLRPDAAATVRGLQQQGIDTILLSGERSVTFAICTELSDSKV